VLAGAAGLGRCSGWPTDAVPPVPAPAGLARPAGRRDRGPRARAGRRAARPSVEYGDFECPFCGRATGTSEELRGAVRRPAALRLPARPLVDVHPHAGWPPRRPRRPGPRGGSGRCTTGCSPRRTG
jgi:hypothetical protein